MLPILDVDSAVEGLDHMGRISHGMSGETFFGMLIGLTAVVLGLCMPVFIVVAVLRHRLNRQRLIAELAVKLAEKGQPLPPDLFMEAPRQKSDLRRGIIWAAIGMGLVAFGGVDDNSSLMGIGFIPLMIGLGFAIAAWLENKQKAPPL
jgi:hypothetical protein